MIKKKRRPYPSINNMYLERTDNWVDNSVTYSFFYGDEPCKHLVLDSVIAKKIASYSLIEKDLLSAYGSIEYLINLQSKSIKNGELGLENENTKFLILKSLHQAAVVTYGKCFADASGGKSKSKRGQPRGVKLNYDIIKDFPVDQKKAHEYLITTRNNYVAHGGATDYEQSLSFVIVSPQNKIISSVLSMESHTATAPLELLKKILELIKNVQKSLKKMQVKKSESIKKFELSKLTDNDIKRQSTSHLKLSVGDSFITSQINKD